MSAIFAGLTPILPERLPSKDMVDAMGSYRPRTLTVLTCDRALAEWMTGFPRPLIDLSRLERFDAYAMGVLVLLGRWTNCVGGKPRFLLPERVEVARALASTGIFHFVTDYWADRPLPEAPGGQGEFVILQVQREEKIMELVDFLAQKLRSRFPFGERANRLIVKGAIELLQNIPQHAGVGLVDRPLLGFCVLEEAVDHLHLAVVDQGVGLAGSLRANPRFRDLTTAEALEAVLVEGASRFDDPGRGGALRSIREAVRSNAGKMYVRTGDGAFLQEDVEWSVGRVPHFPGVQISIRLPRYLFERGEG